jgi:CRP/FNR family transcriptional activator FtrB
MRPGVEALGAIPLFASCATSTLDKLNSIADLARLGPDEVLFRPGDQVDELNVLLTGCVVTTYGPSSADDNEADVVEPVRPIGLTAALLGGSAPFGARTVTSARIIVISAPELRAMIPKVPALGSSFLSQALNELQGLTVENYSLKLRTTPERLADYLLSLLDDPDTSPARFVLPIEKRFLAAKLGCSPATLSRIFKSLRAIGVSTEAGVVLIRDVSQLRDYAGS